MNKVNIAIVVFSVFKTFFFILLGVLRAVWAPDERAVEPLFNRSFNDVFSCWLMLRAFCMG